MAITADDSAYLRVHETEPHRLKEIEKGRRSLRKSERRKRVAKPFEIQDDKLIITATRSNDSIL